jgi:hypothetical protein
MIKKAISIFATLMLGLMIASCEKIERNVISDDVRDFTASMDKIPLQYGRLVSATSGEEFTNILWFEQADQTIVGVKINVARGTMSEKVIRVERN